MTDTKQELREVELWSHTTCGLAFEIVDHKTQKSITGRMDWCSDEDLENEYAEFESRGWDRFEKMCAQKGWVIVSRHWS